MALEDTLAGDLHSIRLTMQAALEFIEEMAAGRAWDDGLTGILDPVWKANTLATLQRKIVTINDWITADGVFIGTPTQQEYFDIEDFSARWDADVLANKMFGYRCYNSPLEPPVRGKPKNEQPVFDPTVNYAVGGADLPPIIPATEHEEPNPQS